MTRYATWGFLLLSIVLVFILYKLENEVDFLEEDIKKLQSQIQRDHQSLHVLQAEWAHVTDPSRLQYLAEKYLSMRVLKPQQFYFLEDERLGLKHKKKAGSE